MEIISDDSDYEFVDSDHEEMEGNDYSVSDYVPLPDHVVNLDFSKPCVLGIVEPVMEQPEYSIEQEISYSVPISPSHYNLLKKNLAKRMVYMEYSFRKDNEKYKIRLGPQVIHKTIKAESSHYLHTSLYSKVPPIVYSLKYSEERILHDIKPSLWERAQYTVQVERYYQYRGKANSLPWRESVTRQINKSSHSTYWYTLEKEQVSTPTAEDLQELVCLVNEFWDSYSVPPLPRLPFRDQHVGFTHTINFPTTEVLFKHKIDGLNFIANYSEEGGWKSRCEFSSKVDNLLKELRLRNPHVILFGEYNDTSLYITELAYVRQLASFINLEEYHTLSTNHNMEKLICTDLYNSARAMNEMAVMEPIVKINTAKRGIPPRQIPPGCDGYLILDQAHRYIKLKDHHTIEVLMKDGFLYSRFGKLMIPLKIESSILSRQYLNKIIELKLKDHTLSFVKIREDKVLPDTIEKIWQILCL